MSYSPEQIEQANQECRHLTSRTGAIINPDYGGNSACMTTIDSDLEELQDSGKTTTAGVGNIPKITWYVIGAGILYYVGKKQKWF